jgi:hypothetical protein
MVRKPFEYTMEGGYMIFQDPSLLFWELAIVKLEKLSAEMCSVSV